MKFYVFSMLLLLSLPVAAQPGGKMIKGGAGPGLLSNDSVIKKLERIKDSVAKARQIQDSAGVKENISNNMDSFIRLQNEQRDRQKRAAIIRIAIGVALFIVLIIGLRRKTAKKRN